MFSCIRKSVLLVRTIKSKTIKSPLKHHKVVGSLDRPSDKAPEV